MSALLTKLEGARDAAIRTHARDGGSYGQLATAMGVHRATAQSRRNSLPPHGEQGPAELWALGMHADDRDAAQVPAHMRSWSVPWHGYTPVDIGLVWGAADEPDNPADVPDWPTRQAAALIPFDRDHRGYPLNPSGRTGRVGRNVLRWGENACADAIVVAGHDDDRSVLLIRRGDCGQWAIPGGHVDPGEGAIEAAHRELREETGLDLDTEPTVLGRTHVADPRETDHAWHTTTLAMYAIPERITATPADDATEAAWFRFDTLDAVLAATGEELYAAHRPLLQTAIDHLQ